MTTDSPMQVAIVGIFSNCLTFSDALPDVRGNATSSGFLKIDMLSVLVFVLLAGATIDLIDMRVDGLDVLAGSEIVIATDIGASVDVEDII